MKTGHSGVSGRVSGGGGGPAQNRQNADFGPFPACGDLCQPVDATAAGDVVQPPRLEVDPAFADRAVLDERA